MADTITTVPLGRDWKWEASAAGATPSWVVIGGLEGSEITDTPKETDVTVRETGDGTDHVVARHAYSGKITCKHYNTSSDGTTFTRDAGQVLVEGYMGKTGSAAEFLLRLTNPIESKVKTMTVTGSLKGVGGNLDDGTPWELDFKVKGKPSDWEAAGA